MNCDCERERECENIQLLLDVFLRSVTDGVLQLMRNGHIWTVHKTRGKMNFMWRLDKKI